jgi:hypothetical protein
MSDKSRLILFWIIVWLIIIILLIWGISYYGLNTKESAAILLGSAIGAFLGVLLEATLRYKK